MKTGKLYKVKHDYLIFYDFKTKKEITKIKIYKNKPLIFLKIEKTNFINRYIFFIKNKKYYTPLLKNYNFLDYFEEIKL